MNHPTRPDRQLGHLGTLTQYTQARGNPGVTMAADTLPPSASVDRPRKRPPRRSTHTQRRQTATTHLKASNGVHYTLG